MGKISLKILLITLFFTYTIKTFTQTGTFGKELELLKRVDLLPAYRHNQLIEQESSYDRTWGNDDGFSGRYSYIRKENGHLVLAEFEGPGVVNRIWTPTPTDDLVSFLFRWGKNTPVETEIRRSFSGKIYPFVNPICGNEVGGYYCYIPSVQKIAEDCF